MTHIATLMKDLLANLPHSQDDANHFLSKYSLDDQCALISAIYIGRDHIHYDHFIEESEETSAYFLPSDPYSRFFSTGNLSHWLIPPSDFAQIISEKANNLRTYFNAFIRCSQNSGYNMANF